MASDKVSDNDLLEGVEATSDEKEPQETLADGDTAIKEDTQSSEEPVVESKQESTEEEEDYQVPLNKLLKERGKRQEFERKFEELQATYEKDRAALDEFKAALPEIQETWQARQRLESEKEDSDEKIKALEAAMAESGVDIDTHSIEDKRMLRSLAAQVNGLPKIMQAQLQDWQRDQERRAKDLEDQRETQRVREVAKERFGNEFNSLTKDFPALNKQKEIYEGLFESSGGRVSAEDLLTPIIATMKAPAAIKKIKKETPNTQTGTSTETPEGAPITAVRKGETISDLFARLRKAQASGLL